MPRNLPRYCLFLLALTYWVLPALLVAEDAGDEGPRPAVVRLLPPSDGAADGTTRIESLLISVEVARLVFFLDGEEVAGRNRPPWEVRIPFASPAREQELRVVAHDPNGKELGGDRLLVNRVDPPLRVRFTAVDKGEGFARLAAEPSVPRGAELVALRFFLNDRLAGTVAAAPFEVRIELVGPPSPQDLVRVEMELADGRRVEDVEILAAPGLSEEVDVNLIQLQVLVTGKGGPPVTDLKLEDFEVRQRGEVQRVDRLYRAADISLVLGLVIDTSGSMVPVWGQAREAARQFLSSTMGERDRAFLVTFDSGLSLVHPTTGEEAKLHEALESIGPDPQGMTALYDSVLFSMLQFQQEPGRRALVVLTDGFDMGSKSRPKRAVEFGRKLGVPVYVVAFSHGSRGGRPVGVASDANAMLQELKLLTQPTGGRLIRVGSVTGLAQAFTQINDELRHQYVLTYYTDQPPTGTGKRELEVSVPGRKGVEVRTILALDQTH